jgi:putative tryptophan/tyrosine transport system substrate-binding protein
MKRREFIAGLGSAAAWPFTVLAQTKPTVIWFDVRPGLAPLEAVEAFRRGLAEVGFSEGRDVTVEYHTSDGHFERLPGLANDLVRRRPTAIFASSPGSALAAKAATQIIPIIFNAGKRSGRAWLGGQPQSSRRQSHRRRWSVHRDCYKAS